MVRNAKAPVDEAFALNTAHIRFLTSVEQVVRHLLQKSNDF
jgi:hypothetical protein